MARPSREEQVKKQRKERIKWGDPKLRMSIDQETLERYEKEGKVLRWVNDEGNRVDLLARRGYEFCASDGSEQVGDQNVGGGNTDLGTRISKVVGKTKEGKPLRAYLMAIDREYYEEDQELKEAENRKVDEAIMKGSPTGPNETTVNSSQGRTYVKPETKYTP